MFGEELLCFRLRSECILCSFDMRREMERIFFHSRDAVVSESFSIPLFDVLGALHFLQHPLTKNNIPCPPIVSGP